MANISNTLRRELKALQERKRRADQDSRFRALQIAAARVDTTVVMLLLQFAELEAKV